MLVVSVVPFALQHWGVAGHEAFSGSARALDPARLPVLVGAALAGVLLLGRLRIANAWVLGPLFCIGALAALEVPLSALPGWAVSGGQLLLGTALGCRFSPDFFRAAPRFLTVSAASTLLALLLSAAFVMVLGHVVPIPVSSLALAASPGGMAEMCVTAKVMHLAVPLITATHVLRVVLLTVWAPRMCGVFLRVFGR
jgi:membrane AbrB-like protein